MQKFGKIREFCHVYSFKIETLLLNWSEYKNIENGSENV